jgi:hypothetical protein
MHCFGIIKFRIWVCILIVKIRIVKYRILYSALSIRKITTWEQKNRMEWDGTRWLRIIREINRIRLKKNLLIDHAWTTKEILVLLVINLHEWYFSLILCHFLAISWSLILNSWLCILQYNLCSLVYFKWHLLSFIHSLFRFDLLRPFSYITKYLSLHLTFVFDENRQDIYFCYSLSVICTPYKIVQTNL